MQQPCNLGNTTEEISDLGDWVKVTKDYEPLKLIGSGSYGQVAMA